MQQGTYKVPRLAGILKFQENLNQGADQTEQMPRLSAFLFPFNSQIFSRCGLSYLSQRDIFGKQKSRNLVLATLIDLLLFLA